MSVCVTILRVYAYVLYVLAALLLVITSIATLKSMAEVEGSSLGLAASIAGFAFGWAMVFGLAVAGATSHALAVIVEKLTIIANK